MSNTRNPPLPQAEKPSPSLVPLNPDSVRYEQLDNGGWLWHVRRKGGQEVALLSRDVLYIPFMCLDHPLEPVSPIQYQARVFGIAQAGEDYASKGFESGGSKRLALLKKQPFKDKTAKEFFIDSFEKAYSGNAKTALFEGEIDVKEIGMSAEDLQAIETRKFTVDDIAARVFRIPPHMAGSLDRATFSNITDQTLSFVKYTMLPWVRRFESAFNDQLLGNDPEYYAEFTLEGLMRGDQASRYNAYHTAINDGWMSRNEVRALENLNPEEGLDEFLEPQNMRPAGQGDEEEDAPEEEPVNDEPADTEPLVADIAQRLANAEIRELDAHLAKAGDDADRFRAWAKWHYERFELHVTQATAPLVAMTKADLLLIVQSVAGSACKAWTNGHRPDIEAYRANRKAHIAECLKAAIGNNRLTHAAEAAALWHAMTAQSKASAGNVHQEGG
jgi:HK97 family phage portal protein